jgi:hypothetical protein
MRAGVFNAVVLGLVAGVALLVWQPWGADADEIAATGSVTVDPEQAANELGYYPPAPSTAVGMTPDWRRFADQVDRICGVTYNYMTALDARIDQVAAARGWSDAKREAANIQTSANQGVQILRATAKLGDPPARPDLFERWRANVAKRAAIKARASDAAAEGRWNYRAHLMNRVYRLKDQGDVIGQQFGLRICTSN